MDINTHCSKYFKYIDFIECSDTQKSVRVDNIPKQIKTFESIAYLANSILDPVYEKFGPLNLTYGLCSHNLQKHVKKNVAPNLDQHAASELNSKGNLICPREGFAVDFRIANVGSKIVADYIVKELNFDRLYYYGNDRPIHVSANEAEPLNSIIIFNHHQNGKVPRKTDPSKFLNMV